MDSVNDGDTDDVPTFFLFAGEPEPEPVSDPHSGEEILTVESFNSHKNHSPGFS